LKVVFSLRSMSLYTTKTPAFPCRGDLEYFHRSPTSRKGRQKGNPTSNETAAYSLKFCGTWTREWQRGYGPGASVRANYRPILSSEREPQIKNCKYLNIVFEDEKEHLVAGLRWPETRTVSPAVRRRKITLTMTFDRVLIPQVRKSSIDWTELSGIHDRKETEFRPRESG
jgi:hypothetical protein